MKLYNQTKNHLRWNISMTEYTCVPWGEVEVPDMFVEHCKVRGLPLGTVAVAPEVKAGASLEAATEAARKDEILALEKGISDAKAAERVAKEALEKALLQNSKLVSDLQKSNLETGQAEEKYKALVSEHNALNKLLEETAKQLELETAARKRAEATVEELKSNKPEAKPQQKK